MRLEANDEAFFPYAFVTEGQETFLIPRLSLTKDYELRQVARSAMLGVEDAVGLLLGGPSIMKGLILAFQSASSTWLSEITSRLIEKPKSWIEEHLTSAEQIEIVISLLYTPTDEADEARAQSGNVWGLARLLEFFAETYSWDIDTVLGYSRWELKAIMAAAAQRFEEQERASRSRKGTKGSRSAQEMLKARQASQPVPGRPQNLNADGSPNWEKSHGAASLQSFAMTQGLEIKKQGGAS